MSLLLLLALLSSADVVDGGAGAADSAVDGPPTETARAVGAGPSDAVPAAVAKAHVRGRVLAKGSRNPIAGASVSVEPAQADERSAEADDAGAFDLELDCGKHKLVVRAAGFDSWSMERDPCTETGAVVARLAPRSDLPVYETIVTAERDEPSVALRGPELTSTPGSLGDPLRTIESLPGVAAVAWPAPIYAIRGSNPGNTGYFLDDLRVPLLFHMALGPSVIHPHFFDGLAFYPGGYPARYGRYVGGVVSAQTRAPAEDRMHAEAEIRLYDAGALASVPWPDNNGGVAVAFRYSYTAALTSLLQDNVSLSYWDYQLRADRQVYGWRLSLLVFGSADSLADKNNPTEEFLTQFHRASLRARHSIGAGELSFHVAAGVDRTTAPIVRDYFVTERAKSIVPRAFYRRSGDAIDCEVGVDGELEWLTPTVSVLEAGASDLARTRRAVLLAGYAEATIRAGSRLTLTPALRYDRYTISGSTAGDLGPRLSARLRLDSKTDLVASGGRFSQAPSLGIQIPAAENFGLGLYGLQTSWQAAVGLATQHVPGVRIEMTGYLQRYVLTDLRDAGLVDADPMAHDFLVRRDARSYGLELLLRRPLTERLYGWLSYTLSQSQRALGSGVIGPSDWDQRHILNLVLGYRWGPYVLGARGHLNTGRPILVAGAQAETFVRLPTFYQLDLRAERKFLFNSFTLHVYLEVVNATLARETYQIVQDPGGRLTERSMRIFLPSLGVRGEL